MHNYIICKQTRSIMYFMLLFLERELERVDTIMVGAHVQKCASENKKNIKKITIYVPNIFKHAVHVSNILSHMCAIASFSND